MKHFAFTIQSNITDLIYFSIILFIILALQSCGQGVSPTPSQYKFKVSIDENKYKEDSINVSFVLEKMLYKNLEPFTPPAYYGKKSVSSVDSILYNPDKLRAVALIISKVPKVIDSESLPDSSGRFEFNANYLFCYRASLDSVFRVCVYSPVTLSNFSNYLEAKNSLFEYCFLRRMTDHPWKGDDQRYNMDDIRFWTSREFSDIISNEKFIELE